MLANNIIYYHRGAPPDGADSMFHGVEAETWLLQGKAQWCWVVRRESGCQVSLHWIRGGRRVQSAEEFVVENVMNVSSGVAMSGIANYHYDHGLYIEEGGLKKLVYMHLKEPPLFVNKVIMINTL